jgi:hypothetical protein
MIFVVELKGARRLAFEAAHEEQASSFARTAWFNDALTRYFASKNAGRSEVDLKHAIRPATQEEESIYRDFAREFTDLTGCFLFAPVSKLQGIR